jgi:hypothetical protein
MSPTPHTAKPEILDRTLPARLRRLAADLDDLMTHVSGVFAGLEPPAPDTPLATAHAFAADLDRRVAAFRSWVESDSLPEAGRVHRAEFRIAAEHLAASARRLSAATEMRRVDELIERASEALGQGSLYLDAAMMGVLADITVELRQLGVPGPASLHPPTATALEGHPGQGC